MPRARSSGAASISSYALNFAPPRSASTLVIAEVNDVLPWSTWPMVPMLTCGLFLSNFCFAINCYLHRLQEAAVTLLLNAINATLAGELQLPGQCGRQSSDTA